MALRVGLHPAGPSLQLPVVNLARLATLPQIDQLVARPIAVGWTGGRDRRWWTLAAAHDHIDLLGALRAGELTADRVAAAGLDVVRTLRRLHGAHLYHLDISPANVLLAGGAALLTDFDSLTSGIGDGPFSVDGIVEDAASAAERLMAQSAAEAGVGDGGPLGELLRPATPDHSAPWLREGWFRRTWASGWVDDDHELQVAGAWHALELAGRADLYSTLSSVKDLLDRTSVQTAEQHQLLSRLSTWLFGDPEDVPFDGDPRRDLHLLLAEAARGRLPARTRLRSLGQDPDRTSGLEVEDRFTGRVVERERLLAHLEAESGPAGLIVRAPAGAGKTALLGWLARQSEDGFGRTRVDMFLEGAPIRTPSSWAQIRLALTNRLGLDALPEGAPDADIELVQRIHDVRVRTGRPIRVIVDGLDEAEAEATRSGVVLPPGVALVDRLHGLLRASAGGGDLRMVVGVRTGSSADRHLDRVAHADPDVWRVALQLPGGRGDTGQPAYDLAVADLATYLRRLLPDALPVGRGAQLAWRIATAAHGNFLIGQTTAAGLPPSGDPGTVTAFPATVGAAFDEFIRGRVVAAPPTDVELVMRLLTAVALMGSMPIDDGYELWGTVAAALRATPDDPARTIDALRSDRFPGIWDYILRGAPGGPATHSVSLMHAAVDDWLLDPDVLLQHIGMDLRSARLSVGVTLYGVLQHRRVPAWQEDDGPAANRWATVNSQLLAAMSAQAVRALQQN